MPVPICQALKTAFLVIAAAAFPGHASAADRPISFVNDVQPILTKAGCNAGACHAKAITGQRGF